MKKHPFLTPSEEQVMLRLWRIEKGSVKDILNLYTSPKPAYNTISTIVRILEKKNYILHKKRGRGYVYKPSISKEHYRKTILNHLIEHYYDQKSTTLISEINTQQRLTDMLSNGLR
jgi:BlaI family transcriptional regulator, penicillinase repressor